MEPASLAYILGRVRGRSANGLATHFRLPRLDPEELSRLDAFPVSGGDVGLRTKDRALIVRNVLRKYNFPQAVRDATGLAFNKLVDENDLGFFGETSSGAPDETFSAEFIAFKVYASSGASFDRKLAVDEAERWVEPYIVRVLNRHLKAKDVGRRVSTHIVNEGVMNAIRHPKAGILITACQFDKAGKHLTILVYDDGASVLDTLAKVVRDGYRVRSDSTPAKQRTYQVVDEILLPGAIKAVVRGELEIKSDHVLSTLSPDFEILAAAFLPGVTRTPFRSPGDVDSHKEAIDEDESLGKPGMGLSVLLNNAVDVFGGQVSLRSGYHFVNAKAGDRSQRTDYRIKVREYPRVSGLFHGNLLTIRLPLDR
jgi:anti-sigma regulatory factor (Ser/Thr protein kinase)